MLLVAALAAALTACTPAGRIPVVASVTPAAVSTVLADVLRMRPVDVPTSPSPLVEVQVGSVRAFVPKGWDARLLPDGLAHEGFEASPQMAEWDRGTNAVPGIEAFWVDLADGDIPSDYYYLAARSVSFGGISHGRKCESAHLRVVANHPPDFTGGRYSPSDFVASVHGRCTGPDGSATRWGYVVAAPGFGPARSVGIPTSGLYVVMAEVGGPHAEALLREMLSKAKFGDDTLTQIMRAAGREQPH
jgi:hypothetical protein